MSKCLFLDSEGQTNPADFTVHPNINLTQYKHWEIGIKKINVYNSWFNISQALGNNYVKVSADSGATWEDLYLDDGAYNFEDFVTHWNDCMIDLGLYTNVGDVYTFPINWYYDKNDGYVNVSLNAGYRIDFTVSKLWYILGFTSAIITLSQRGDNEANFSNDVDTIMVHLDIIAGNSYFNNYSTDIIYSFAPDAPPFGIIENEVQHVTYVKINSNYISSVRLYLTDQLNRRIKFNGTSMTAEFHIKPIL